MRHRPVPDIFTAFAIAEPADCAQPFDEYRDLAMLAQAWERGALGSGLAEQALGRGEDAEGKDLPAPAI